MPHSTRAVPPTNQPGPTTETGQHKGQGTPGGEQDKQAAGQGKREGELGKVTGQDTLEQDKAEGRHKLEEEQGMPATALDKPVRELGKGRVRRKGRGKEWVRVVERGKLARGQGGG